MGREEIMLMASLRNPRFGFVSYVDKRFFHESLIPKANISGVIAGRLFYTIDRYCKDEI